MQFETDKREAYELMQIAARACVDGTYDRLHALAEADRDGRCVVLPCKVGDTVYCISDCSDGVDERTIDRLVVCNDGRISISDGPYDGHICYADELGKIVGNPFWSGAFLTRAEAEAALGKEQQ